MRVLCYSAKLEAGGWVAGCPALNLSMRGDARVETENLLRQTINEMWEQGVRPAFRHATLFLVDLDDGPDRSIPNPSLSCAQARDALQ